MLGNHASDGRELRPAEVGLDRRIAGKEPISPAGVLSPFMMQATDQGKLVGQPGQQGQLFTDLDPGNICFDRTKRAPILSRCIGLKVKQVQVAGSPVCPEEDYRVVIIELG